MKEQGNFEAYGTANRYGVTTRYTDLRNFPTSKPLFKDPATAGEGYPFDYLQNSSIHANEPIYISHYSKEGGWAYVFTSYATGWIDVRNIAYIDKTKRTTWMKAKQIYITVDDYPITNSRGEFLMYSKVGMLLPAIDLSSDAYEAMVVTASINGKPHYHTVELPRHSARETVSAFTKENVLPLIDEILQTTYGWGGIDKERDCSSTLRDLFAPMGIWLPRNSYQQAQVGKKIDLSRMSDQEKVERITQEAIPFETLLYKKGHILLYLGSYEGNIAVFHNVWGIKTLRNGVEGRKVIGKSVITSLQPGKEQPDYDESEDILKNLMSMNVITAAQAE
jgi:cell wall-associated NlpC family hydrolase